jgi:hypothetical protein
VELRAIENGRRAHETRGPAEFWEDEFPELG